MVIVWQDQKHDYNEDQQKRIHQSIAVYYVDDNLVVLRSYDDSRVVKKVKNEEHNLHLSFTISNSLFNRAMGKSLF